MALLAAARGWAWLAEEGASLGCAAVEWKEVRGAPLERLRYFLLAVAAMCEAAKEE